MSDRTISKSLIGDHLGIRSDIWRYVPNKLANEGQFGFEDYARLWVPSSQLPLFTEIELIRGPLLTMLRHRIWTLFNLKGGDVI